MWPKSSLFRAGTAASERSLKLLGQEVPYRLCRSRRRTIGLTIDQRGLRVGAPQGASLKTIEALILKHGAWVLEKLARWQEQELVPALVDGATLPYLGAALTLRLPEGLKRSCWHATELELAIAPGASLEASLAKVLKSRARPLFLERLEIYAARLGVPTPLLALSSARTRWGSCNSKGEIRLNWRLIHFDLALIDYVVAHELAHLKEMNHSPRFWAVVEQLYPDWRQARAELKRQAPGLPRL